MLVPNPVLVTKTQIGNKDYDLVSELSERASVVSFDNSSVSQSGSECDEEMVESRQEGEEADQEYTIYDLLPPARLPQAGLAWLSVPSDVTPHQGKIVTLHCAVQGDKPIDVAWFKKSELISKSAKYWIHRKKESHFLTIFDLLKEDCGSYSCVAFNKSAELWHSIALT